MEKTIDVLKALGKPATADMVAAASGRKRAVDSNYLNELSRNGVIEKRRVGHSRVFTLREEYRAKG
jgi:predicted transcriptional regulator